MGELIKKYKTSPNRIYVSQTYKKWELEYMRIAANDNLRKVKTVYGGFLLQKLIKKLSFKWRIWRLERSISRLTQQVKRAKNDL